MSLALRSSGLPTPRSRKKDVTGDENLVLQAIQASKNEGESFCDALPMLMLSGIWTKHLKNKTELHQTVITRCLKSLEQKQLIKSIKSVKVPGISAIASVLIS